MNTSLPILPGTGAVPKTVQGLGENISINQHDMTQESGFGELLGNFHSALSESLSPVLPGEAVAGELLAELQELPEGGKLLPLLQGTLDAAAALGLDGQQLLDDVASQGLGNQQLLDEVASQGLGNQQLLDKLSASLETLQPAEVEQMAQSLSGLMQQLNDKVSATMGSFPGEGTVFSLPGKIDTVAPQGNLAEIIQQQLRPQTAGSQLPNTPDAAVLKQSLSETLPQASQAGLDKALEQLQQQSQTSEGRQNDLALLMAAFRRQRTEGANRTAGDSHARPDLLPAGAATVATVAAGNAASSSALPTTSVQTPLGQANWDQAVGERIQWMVGQKMQGAQVKLNPANLGPMEVRIQVQNDQASVQFTAHHAVVREALEAALPRLRDMFESSGVELVDVDVSGHSFAEQKAAGEEGDRNAWGEGTGDSDIAPEMVLESEVASLEHAGRLDLFA